MILVYYICRSNKIKTCFILEVRKRKKCMGIDLDACSWSKYSIKFTTQFSNAHVLCPNNSNVPLE